MSESNDNVLSDDGTAVAEPAKKSRRKPPKTLEQRFLEKQQEAEKLRLQIEEKREELRSELVDALYAKYGIDARKGDPTETGRINRLRSELGLSTV
ncbi:hypothetical protein [Nesterenkonia jeotgali]|uniref:Uncharacterized protein n=1 Tax=Nesterenkonia jeotgali TaxID=317018 RepID=A0A839FX55_9MICC|nr:hypothetical protein [Nesterenkonia jeotgali]MBA8921337.1 hypothetical protein [Nesterenkonia jeotgali]